MRSTERKQQNIMNFLAKAFSNPMFMQQYMDKHAQKNNRKRVEIGQKRRLAMSESGDDFQDVTAVAMGSNQPSDYVGQDPDEVDIQLEMENLISVSLDDESSTETKNPSAEALPSSNNSGFNSFTEYMWEEFLSEELVMGEHKAENAIPPDQIVDVEVDGLVAQTPDWGENLQDLVDQLEFL